MARGTSPAEGPSEVQKKQRVAQEKTNIERNEKKGCSDVLETNILGEQYEGRSDIGGSEASKS